MPPLPPDYAALADDESAPEPASSASQDDAAGDRAAGG
jgi:hypothetical protein